MASSRKTPPAASPSTPVEQRDEVTLRFAGDSGDGMQLLGARFTATCASVFNDVSTFPDFPAEIRAPAGSLAGVSGFQIHFSAKRAHTAGDALDVLVVMNPAALQANLGDLKPGGILIVNVDAFTADDLARAGYAANPLAGDALAAYRLVALPMNQLNRQAIAKVKLNPREIDRCRNFFALGLVYWLFDLPLDPTLNWIRDKFVRNPGMLEGNSRALRGGYDHAQHAPLLPTRYHVGKAPIPPGHYRRVTGNEALALGLVAAARLAGLPLLFACHPITPASEVLHQLVDLRDQSVRIVQAEDEPGAISMTLGAAFAGALGATATSGPGMSVMAEGLGLAVMSELPCIVINVQRAGPSTGMPTKTEQADLLQALFGRHGEAPLPVLAPSQPGECFGLTLEAARLAVRYMTPVVILSDIHLAYGAEAWRIPPAAELPRIASGQTAAATADEPSFQPYARDANLSRPWAPAGAAGREHRIGGLEKEAGSGHVSYDHLNHEAMVRQRAEKIERIADDIPPLETLGPERGDLLVVGWGGTRGAIEAAVERARADGLDVACAFLRYLNPLPRNTANVLRRFQRILVPELNHGQLAALLRGRLGMDVTTLSKVQGRPFRIAEIEARIRSLLAPRTGHSAASTTEKHTG